MPYAADIVGIYRIVNKNTQVAYVGQSQRCKKRIKEHFRQLKNKEHPNPRLQNSFNKHGEKAFFAEVEVVCEDVVDLDAIENDFLVGNAEFEQPVSYNIAPWAKAPMRGRAHTEATKAKIKKSKAKNPVHFGHILKAKLSVAQRARYMERPGHREKVLRILEMRNSGTTFTQIAKELGYTDPSTPCTIYHRYKDVKGI